MLWNQHLLGFEIAAWGKQRTERWVPIQSMLACWCAPTHWRGGFSKSGLLLRTTLLCGHPGFKTLKSCNSTLSNLWKHLWGRSFRQQQKFVTNGNQQVFNRTEWHQQRQHFAYNRHLMISRRLTKLGQETQVYYARHFQPTTIIYLYIYICFQVLACFHQCQIMKMFLQ